jgi:hypothetical protein
MVSNGCEIRPRQKNTISQTTAPKQVQNVLSPGADLDRRGGDGPGLFSTRARMRRVRRGPRANAVRLGWPCTREPNSGEGRAPASGVGSWGLEGPDAWFARPRRSLAKSSARVLGWGSVPDGPVLWDRFVGSALRAGPAASAQALVWWGSGWCCGGAAPVSAESAGAVRSSRS